MNSERSIVVNRMLEECSEFKEDRSYIYSLFEKESCIYVGQTKNLQQRIYSHLADGKLFDRVDMESCLSSEANDKEADAIVKLSPILNKSLPKTDKYVSLANFRKDIVDMIMDLERLNIVFESNSNRTNRLKYIEKSAADNILDDINEWMIMNTPDFIGLGE